MKILLKVKLQLYSCLLLMMHRLIQGLFRKKSTTLLHWKPPDNGTVCINVDATFSEDSGKATAGIVIRNHTGSVCLAACNPLSNCDDAEEAEAKAILLGMQIAQDYSFIPSSVLLTVMVQSQRRTVPTR